ncbi:MAG: Zinc ABC transporter, substrate-binding protein ZnuA [Candidatus Bipolaricaulis sibiricus]|uniref:Zinc ABC transporter, substrate-binding protein ZnuA n=1 Tax=Bipolaricaulis sibiricus TaxID=2501609 RepID=A0A410FRZ5_BIPS1|nr:MAG: Zinc ABC transporter, substrate-binding protein ZnuA [Candidatus Bipolaricaulis sibiricus]
MHRRRLHAVQLLGGALAAALGLGVQAVAAPLVVATTGFVGDVVRQIGGDEIRLTVLFPVGADPHGFEPTPADAVLLARAEVVFAVGAGLEEGLAPLLSSTGARVVELATFVPLLSWPGHDEDDIDHEHGEHDPHVWLDPTRVALWTEAIADALAELAPEHTALFVSRAAAYREELAQLDRWIVDQVGTIPEEARLLVSDHRVLGYFAHRYGFRVPGAVLPSLSTLAEPAARELAELVATIRALGVRAVFVATTVNPQLAEQVSRDAGVRVVSLYTHSLSDPTGPAPTYIDMMRYNVRAIVAALGG